MLTICCLLAVLMFVVLGNLGVPFVGRPFPVWVEIVFWIQDLVVVALLFFLGTKLNLLGSHWLNFLSVSGILMIGLFLTVFITYISAFVSFAFMGLGLFLAENINNPRVGLSILSVLPSTLIWLGMLYQLKRIKAKNTSRVCGQ